MGERFISINGNDYKVPMIVSSKDGKNKIEIFGHVHDDGIEYCGCIVNNDGTITMSKWNYKGENLLGKSDADFPNVEYQKWKKSIEPLWEMFPEVNYIVRNENEEILGFEENPLNETKLGKFMWIGDPSFVLKDEFNSLDLEINPLESFIEREY